jgi:hypothetical protein
MINRTKQTRRTTVRISVQVLALVSEDFGGEAPMLPLQLPLG